MRADQRVRGKIAVADVRADPHAAIGCFFDAIERQPRDIDQPLGRGHAEPHVVDQIGTAAEEHRAGIRDHGSDGLGGVAGALVRKRIHDSASCRATARIAATMLT